MNIKQETRQLNLKINPERVKQLEIAYGNTVVMLMSQNYGKSYEIHHIDQEGQTIEQYQHTNQIQSFIMPTADIVFVPFVRKNYIYIIYLRKEEDCCLQYHFSQFNRNQMKFFNFRESKLFCFGQTVLKKPQNKKQSSQKYDSTVPYQKYISLTYLTPQFKLIALKEVLVEEKVSFFEKINNHSAIIVCSMDKKNKSLNFYIHKLRQDEDYFYPQEQSFSVPLRQFQFHDFGNSYIFEINSDMIFLYPKRKHTSTRTTFVGQFNVERKIEESAIVVDLKQKELRKISLDFFQPLNNVENVLFIDPLIVFRQGFQNFSTFLADSSTLYFMEKRFGTLMYKIKLEKGIYNYHFHTCLHNPHLLVQWYCSGNKWIFQKKQYAVVIKTTNSCFLAEEYLHFLLHLNDDFDDDLLLDAMILLGHQ